MTLRNNAIIGKTLENEVVIDGHMHPVRVAQFFTSSDLDDTVEKMDLIGIKTGILSMLNDIGETGRHEVIIEIFERYPGRFYGYIAPDPYEDGFLAALEKWAKVPRFVGIKLHPVQDERPFDCKEYLSAYAFGGEAGFPVLIHTWGMADITEIEKLAKKYPKTALIMGHSGGERDAAEYAIKLAGYYENVYLDTTRSYCYNGEIEKMVEGATDRKILFGSDATWNSMEAAIGRVLLADISDESKRRIIGKNARELFKLNI